MDFNTPKYLVMPSPLSGPAGSYHFCLNLSSDMALSFYDGYEPLRWVGSKGRISVATLITGSRGRIMAGWMDGGDGRTDGLENQIPGSHAPGISILDIEFTFQILARDLPPGLQASSAIARLVRPTPT